MGGKPDDLLNGVLAFRPNRSSCRRAPGITVCSPATCAEIPPNGTPNFLVAAASRRPILPLGLLRRMVRLGRQRQLLDHAHRPPNRHTVLYLQGVLCAPGRDDGTARYPATG